MWRSHTSLTFERYHIMITRIHWTTSECNAVLQKALALYHSGGMQSQLAALRIAQTQELPKERHRAFTTHSAATVELRHMQDTYPAYIKSLAQKPLEQKEVVTPTVVDPVPPAPSEPPPAPPPTISLDAMVEAIAARVAATLVQAIKREVKELEHEFKLEKHNPTYEGVRICKPHVTIIGLLPDQEHLMQREYGDKFVLRFLGNEAARHADVVKAHAYLLMKNFISHAVYNKYKSLPQHVLIDGGMSTLRMWFNTKGVEL